VYIHRQRHIIKQVFKIRGFENVYVYQSKYRDRLFTITTLSRMRTWKVNLYLRFTKHRAVKACRGVEVLLCALLTAALEGGGCSFSLPDTHCIGSWLGPRAGLHAWRRETSLVFAGNRVMIPRSSNLQSLYCLSYPDSPTPSVEPEVLVLWSQEPVIRPFLEPDKSNPHPHMPALFF
jgi:hypothetical protein